MQEENDSKAGGALQLPPEKSLGNPAATILVGSNGGTRVEMTVAEADLQVQAETQKAIAKAPPGAEVKVVHQGETTSVVTHLPGNEKPKV